MASFAKQLAKGFVRSAVNQVGRDGGRVISNQIYNGQNYVPVSNVGHQSSQIPPTPNSIPHGAVFLTKPFSGMKIFFLTLLSFLYPIGTLVVFIYGLVKFNDTMTKVEWYTVEAQYKRDLRYKEGRRYLGTAKVMHSAKVTAPDNIRAINMRNGKLAMIIAAIIGILIGISIVIGK